MKNLEADIMTLMDLANVSISDNWGFYPVTREEARAMARDLKQVINPKAAIIAEDKDGRPIGFAISLPDINLLLKGLDGKLGYAAFGACFSSCPGCISTACGRWE
jgi:hypothetical protein